MGRISGETTSALSWQLATSIKCSVHKRNLFPLPCSIVPSLATRDDEAGLENFLFKIHKFFYQGTSSALLFCHESLGFTFSCTFASPIISSFHNCNFSQLFEMEKLSLKTSVVLGHCILQMLPGFLLFTRKVADFIT